MNSSDFRPEIGNSQETTSQEGCKGAKYNKCAMVLAIVCFSAFVFGVVMLSRNELGNSLGLSEYTNRITGVWQWQLTETGLGITVTAMSLGLVGTSLSLSCASLTKDRVKKVLPRQT